jgi:hypothetical protein
LLNRSHWRPSGRASPAPEPCEATAPHCPGH